MKSIALSSCHPRFGYALSALLLATACGGGDDDGDKVNSGSAGTVIAPWDSYCVATFSEDYVVEDPFGEALFTARAGQRYLMTDYGAGFGEDSATLAYLTSAGPYEVQITAPTGTRDFPFTTPCGFDSSTPYYGVFANVTVYAAADLSTKICDLSAASVKRRDTTVQAGYSATGFTIRGPATFEVYLNAFSSDCGGAETGFVSVPETELLGMTTNLVPIISLIGPAS